MVRPRWLSVALFGLTLVFGMSMEVSLWDALVLSESLSFSLLALMLACWACLLIYLPAIRLAWIRWILVALTIVVTILYTFTRDSNIYFVVSAVAVLVFGWLIDQRLIRLKAYILVYAGAVIAIFLAGYISMSLEIVGRYSSTTS